MTEPNFNFPALRDAQAKLDAARTRQKAIFDEAGPDLDMSKVKVISGSTADKVKAIQEAETEMKDLKKEVESLRDVARAAAQAKGYSVERDGKEHKVQVEHKSFEDHILAALPDLKDMSKGRKAFMDVELKTDFTRSAGWAPESVRSGRVELTPLRPAVHVVQFIPSGTISQAITATGAGRMRALRASISRKGSKGFSIST